MVSREMVMLRGCARRRAGAWRFGHQAAQTRSTRGACEGVAEVSWGARRWGAGSSAHMAPLGEPYARFKPNVSCCTSVGVMVGSLKMAPIRLPACPPPASALGPHAEARWGPHIDGIVQHLIVRGITALAGKVKVLPLGGVDVRACPRPPVSALGGTRACGRRADGRGGARPTASGHVLSASQNGGARGRCTGSSCPSPAPSYAGSFPPRRCTPSAAPPAWQRFGRRRGEAARWAGAACGRLPPPMATRPANLEEEVLNEAAVACRSSPWVRRPRVSMAEVPARNVVDGAKCPDQYYYGHRASRLLGAPGERRLCLCAAGVLYSAASPHSSLCPLGKPRSAHTGGCWCGLTSDAAPQGRVAATNGGSLVGTCAGSGLGQPPCTPTPAVVHFLLLLLHSPAGSAPPPPLRAQAAMPAVQLRCHKGEWLGEEQCQRAAAATPVSTTRGGSTTAPTPTTSSSTPLAFKLASRSAAPCFALQRR